jgi:hypothetical protein
MRQKRLHVAGMKHRPWNETLIISLPFPTEDVPSRLPLVFQTG